MPNSTLPGNTYLGDGQRTTAEMQTGLDQVAAWLNAAQAELNALTGTTFGEAAVRGVGNGAGLVPDKAVLDTRLGTTGNLGTAALKADTFFLASSEYQEATVELGGSFNAGESVKCVRVGSMITISGLGDELNHSSSPLPASDLGVIPTWARPPSGNVLNVYYYDNFYFYSVSVFSTGRLQLGSVDSGGSSQSFTNSQTRPWLTFNV